MPPTRRAVIDVGTNSVKLLVADIVGGKVNPLLEKSEQTRLGSGFYETHRLQPAAIAETARVVGAFAAEARTFEPAGLQVVATSAARDALNQPELTEAVLQSCGLNTEIISGDQEAEWVFRGVTTDPKLAGQRLLILDVGGGSTEFILGEGEHHSFRESFPMGSVRLLEKLRPSDPPSIADLAGCRGWLKEFFNQHIAPNLETLLRDASRGEVTLVGTGGTTTILARMEGKMTDYDRDRIESMRFSREQILEYMVHLWSLPLSERKKLVGLPPKRADVILMGVAIYEAAMEHFRFSRLLVSTRGLRFGAVLDGL